PAPPVNEAPPTITGTAQPGQTLTEAHGKWSNSPTSYAYQWQQCDSAGSSCASISGATKQTYEVTPGDVRPTMRAREVHSTAARPRLPPFPTAPASELPAPPVHEAPPTITGTAQPGQTLTEHSGEWSNTPTSYAYQWQQCDSAGSSCASISG